MKNFKVEWTKPSGDRIRSVVSYCQGAAEDRKAQLEGQGMTDVEVVPAKIGEA